MNLDRLKRLLLLVPLAHRHGPKGIPVAEALSVLNLRSAEELVEHVEQLTLVGDPSGTPGDFVEISIEGDRVQVFLPQAFAHPPRFTAVESAAMLAALTPLEDSGLEEVSSLLAKLREAIPASPEGAEEAAVLERLARLEVNAAPAFLAQLEEAVERREEVEIEYFSWGTGERSWRRLEPRTLLLNGGRWYLAAWNPERSQEQLYRLDRMSEVRLTGRPFDAHQGPPTDRYALDHLYVPSGHEQDVEVRFSPRVAHIAETRWPETAERNGDGSVTVRAHLGGDHFLLSWVLGHGGEVELIAPEAVREKLAERVGALQSLYAVR